jgi:hypothetical protein
MYPPVFFSLPEDSRFGRRLFLKKKGGEKIKFLHHAEESIESFSCSFLNKEGDQCF